jgi:hypothetical protein
VFLKNFISVGRLHGNSLFLPITLFVDAATISDIIMPQPQMGIYMSAKNRFFFMS